VLLVAFGRAGDDLIELPLEGGDLLGALGGRLGRLAGLVLGSLRFGSGQIQRLSELLPSCLRGGEPGGELLDARLRLQQVVLQLFHLSAAEHPAEEAGLAPIGNGLRNTFIVVVGHQIVAS